MHPSDADSNAFAIGSKRFDMPDQTHQSIAPPRERLSVRLNSANGVSAVHNQVRAVDHRCHVARQEHGRICDLPRLRETTDRDLCPSELALLPAPKTTLGPRSSAIKSMSWWDNPCSESSLIPTWSAFEEIWTMPGKARSVEHLGGPKDPQGRHDVVGKRKRQGCRARARRRSRPHCVRRHHSAEARRRGGTGQRKSGFAP